MRKVQNTPYRLALIPGDGIGKEVIPAAQRVLEQVSLPLEFIELSAGWETFQQTGNALPESTIATLRGCDAALFGAVSSPSQRVASYSSPIVALRKIFDLYANLRPIASAPVPGSRPDIDLLIVRENTECLYVKQERLEEDGQRAVAERVITRRASQRIARKACEMAQQRQTQANAMHMPHSPLLTIVHKANVLSLTDGLFRESALAVAKEFPQIPIEEQIVDSMIYRLILEPQRYDVIVAPNLYGDILSDAAAALVGGLGLAPSANVGDAFVLCEPVHGSAPDIAGQGVANPVAAIRAAALLLDALGEGQAARRIENAVSAALRERVWTRDLGGTATTAEMTRQIIERL
jgi:homoisocitrate dehydrogenase